MIDIFHFYPNLKISKLFVSPLIDAERKNDFISVLLSSEGGKYPYLYDLKIKNIPFILYSFFRIFWVLVKCKPTIIISHNTRSSLIPLLCANMVGVKNKIYFNHGVPYIGHKWLTRKILKIIEFLNCVLADQIITVSNDMRKKLKSITNKKIDLIHNGSACGIDLNFIRKQSKSKFRHKFKFEKSDFLCVFIGRFEKRKGYNIVINVWKNHFKNNMKMKLLLYGGSPSKTKNNDNKSNIIYMGYTNNISEVLCGADCLFLPSYHEGLSYVALEAAILCCPIIANDIPGITGVVDDKINGYLIKNNNEFEYFKTLSNLQKKQLNKKDLQKKSNQLSKQFDRNIFLSEYIKYFHQI